MDTKINLHAEVPTASVFHICAKQEDISFLLKTCYEGFA